MSHFLVVVVNRANVACRMSHFAGRNHENGFRGA